MLKFEVNGKLGAKVLSLPTKLEEITPEYLKWIGEDVMIASNYSLIALAHREKLSSFILAGRGKGNQMTTSVVPLFIDCGQTDSKFIQSLKPGFKLIISPSDMALGYHVSCPKNTLRMDTLISHIEGDNLAYQKALKEGDVYFLEFKLVPNNTIVGVYQSRDIKQLFVNPFKITNSIIGIN